MNFLLLTHLLSLLHNGIIIDFEFSCFKARLQDPISEWPENFFRREDHLPAQDREKRALRIGQRRDPGPAHFLGKVSRERFGVQWNTSRFSSPRKSDGSHQRALDPEK